MPGISLISTNFVDKQKLSGALDDINSEHHYSSEILYYDSNFVLTITFHESYPYWFYENDDIVVACEGMFYNVTLDRVKDDLVSLSMKDVSSMEKYLHEMVMTCDGDFLVIMYNKKTGECFVFNDYFGRLPAFYNMTKNEFILSREYKFMLHFLSSIAIDRHGLAAFLIWEQKLGDVTLIKNIKRLEAANLIRCRFNTDTRQCEHTIKEVESLNFDVKEPLYDKKECAARIASHILTSIETRHETCSSQGYKNICEVSGGFDTRTVVMGLERLNLNADYYTHGVATGDESRAAKALGAAYGKEVKSVYSSHELEHDMHRITYDTDCMVNVWTAVTSWNDSYHKRSQIDGKTANYMGFGGEYFRHPIAAAPGFHSLSDMLRANIINILMHPEWAGYLSGLEKGEYTAYLGNHFEAYPEHTFEGKLKRFDYEFHKIHNAGEDRTRGLFWTVSPLLSLDLLKFLKTHFPQKLASYSFHVEILKNIGSEGLHIPIHGRWIKPDSDINVSCYDFSKTLISYLRTFILSTGNHKLLKKIRRKRRSQAEYDKLSQQLLQAHDELSLLSEYIPRERIEYFTENIVGISYDKLYFYRLLSVLLYFKELEKRFMDKLVIE